MTHVHLPKPADYGYVAWESGTFLVARGPDFEEIRPLLAALGELTGDTTRGMAIAPETVRTDRLVRRFSIR